MKYLVGILLGVIFSPFLALAQSNDSLNNVSSSSSGGSGMGFIVVTVLVVLVIIFVLIRKQYRKFNE